MKVNKPKLFSNAKFSIILAAILLLTSCSAPTETIEPTSPPPPTQAETPPTTPPLEPPPADTPISTEPQPTEPPAPTTVPAMAPDPQVITFSAEDGQKLTGKYFPAAINPAPLVVLMHWAGGDQEDWQAIAPWLQNRGWTAASTRTNYGGKSFMLQAITGAWLDPSWFPALPVEFSVGVFTFTFRGCTGGCQDFAREKWLLDAQAAMHQAAALPGVDPDRIAAIGASIGADGAADACGKGCLGAMAISPGHYLTVPFPEAVLALQSQAPPKPVWCQTAAGDTPAYQACHAASGENYEITEYPGDPHGMMLFDPAITPNIMEKMIDFLVLVFGL